MIATYHNHSKWSDGRASLEEIVAGARDLGIDEVGVSDHWVLHPTGVTPKWSMDPTRAPEYVEALRRLDSEDGLRVRVGLEVDWFPGHANAIRTALAGVRVDYLVGSVHEVGSLVIDGSPRAWAGLDQSGRDEVHREYWRRMRSLAESALFDIAAHLDLPKKFGYYAEADLSQEIGAALDAIRDARLVVELNTAGWHKPCADAYPTLDILRECHARGIRVTLSADAHEPVHLLRDFDRGAERLIEAGYTEIARFAERETWLDPLPGAPVHAGRSAEAKAARA